jgi:hypothetical protein
MQALQAIRRGMVEGVSITGAHDANRRPGRGKPIIVRAMAAAMMVDLVDIELADTCCHRAFDIDIVRHPPQSGWLDELGNRPTELLERVGSRDWMPPWAHTGLRVDDVKPSLT